MPKKCWIIEQGCYSDYRVVGIFSTKENAEKALAHMKQKEFSDYDEPEINERFLDPCIEELNQGLFQFEVRITKEGIEVLIKKEIDAEDFHWTVGDYYNVWARDEAHAIKIASEKHTRHLAEKAGIA